MKTFFCILILLAVAGFAAMNMGVFGAVVYVLGVVAAIIAMLVALYDRQQRIEEKLDRLLTACERGEEVPAGEGLPVYEEGPEDGAVCKKVIADTE